MPSSTRTPRSEPFVLRRIAVAAVTVLATLACLVELSAPADARTAPSLSAAVTHAHHGKRSHARRRVPRVNRRALAVARSKLGHRYVFGAAGPRAFDCSGLMRFSYGRAGRHIPRVADAQFHAAHRIRRRHLRPGDLVFYHSHGHRGRVFHVGMYVSPGRTVAAVDPAEGVTWQRIHYSDATFGSFTHR